MDIWRSPRSQFVIALVISSLVSVGLFAFGVLHTRSLAFSYLVWNLCLAWLPLIFAVRLAQVLRGKLWSSWEALATSFIWLIFLPNSFYIVSDLIHLNSTDAGVSQTRVLYDAVMSISFAFTGMILGFSSLYLVHLQLRRRMSHAAAATWIAVILFLCSVAMYLGRDLRWNSWDIVVNPAGLLFDISDRVQHVGAYPRMLMIILAFFALLSSAYHLLWRITRLLRPVVTRP